MTRKRVTIAIVGVLVALTVALGLLWERGTVADRGSSVGGGVPERVDTGRGVPGGGAVPEATQQAASSEVEREDISAGAPALIAAQADQLADYVRGELEEYRPQWPTNEHQQYADAVREAILATAERPLSGAEIAEFEQSFHELASNLCFHNEPGKIVLLKRVGGHTEKDVGFSDTASEVAGVRWMVVVWLWRKRRVVSEKERTRLEEQMAEFDRVLDGFVQWALEAGMNRQVVNELYASGMAVRRRARENVLWPFLKDPMTDQLFRSEMARLRQHISWAKRRWRNSLADVSAVDRIVFARRTQRQLRGKARITAGLVVSAHSSIMAHWGMCRLQRADQVEPPDGATLNFWLREFDSHLTKYRMGT